MKDSDHIDSDGSISNGLIQDTIATAISDSEDSNPMTMLIAYDGRMNTEKALDYAIRNSVVYGERLIVLTVITKNAISEIDKAHENAEKAISKARSEGADVQSIVESGQPDKVILETAARFDCNTIIVGRSSKTAFDRVIMGSVSNFIVANAKCTVIVVQ